MCNYFSGCGGFFDDPSGTISSPNYPDNYDNNMNCEYQIEVADDKVGKLRTFEIATVLIAPISYANLIPNVFYIHFPNTGIQPVSCTVVN